MIVCKDFKFDAAHYLSSPGMDAGQRVETYGKCANLHGHTYKLRVGVRGVTNSVTGMVMNFAYLKQIVNEEIIEYVDHTLLNDLDMFRGKIVTAEVMVEVFREILIDAFHQRQLPLKEGLCLAELVLWETETSFVRMEM